MTRRKIVAGNWKMNGSREDAFSLATEIKGMLGDEQRNGVEVILAPPFVHLASVGHIISDCGISLAGQNCASEVSGAFTGEVSAMMLKSVGADYVIIGHSERRKLFNETDEVLFRKTERALENNLTPIFCIGETLAEREAGNHFSTVESQLQNSVFKLQENQFATLILAYEPVWAIGTGQTATPQQAQEMHQFIRATVRKRFKESIGDKVSVLYGGSCNESNAAELFSLSDVDGGLIGGASLKSRSFVNIVKCFK